MKYILVVILSLLAISCSSPKYQVGQIVKTSYCKGQIYMVLNDALISNTFSSYKYLLISAKCGNYEYSSIQIKENDIISGE